MAPPKKGFNRYEIFGETTIIYIENRKGEIFKVPIDTEDLQKLIDLDHSWHISINRKDHYVMANICRTDENGNIRNTTTKLQKIIMNASDWEIVDHINNDTLDHRKQNLRFASNSQNTKNRYGANKNNTSGYRNVMWIDGYWRVVLRINGKNHMFKKKFTDVNKAGRFAEEIRQKYYGEFAGKSIPIN